MKKERSSNIELLRIIAMMLIIAHHSVVHGGLSKLGDSNFNNLLILFMGTGGKLGVNVFVIITGFFDVGKKFKVGKVAAVEGSCWFYGILCAIGALIYGTVTFDSIKISQFAFPLWNNLYWFMTCFAILYCLSGYINKLIENISKNKLAILIVILFVINFASSFRFLRLYPAFGKMGQNRLVWFVMLYLIGAFLRLYPNTFTKNIKQELIALAGFMVLYVSKIAIGGFTKTTITYALFSDFSLIFAILLFLIFKNIKMGCIKPINVIASCMIGVYLFHDNPFIRQIIWKKISNIGGYVSGRSLIFREGITVIVIMAIGIVLDLIRQNVFSPIFRKLGQKFVAPLYEKISLKINADEKA